jgi:signal transduction histidine kinase
MGKVFEEESSSVNRKRLSLRLRLTLLVMAISAVIQVIAGVLALLYERSTWDAFFNHQLDSRASAVIEELKPLLPNVKCEVLEAMDRREVAYGFFGEFGLSVLDPQGIVLARHGNQSSGAIRRLEKQFVAGDGRRYGLEIAARSASTEKIVDQSALAIILSVPIGVLAAGVGGWFIAGIAVAPFRHLSRFARQLRPDSLTFQFLDPGGVTEVAQLNRELRAALQRLEAGYQAQGRFVANVSHQLKTPITALLVEAHTISRRAELSEEVRGFIRSTEEELQKLAKLIESFLILTRVQHGRVEAQFLKCLVNEVVSDSVAHCGSMARQFGVLLKASLLKDDDEMELTIPGDAELLRTMIDNLIRNAIRFSPRGQSVHVAASKAGSHVLVRVRDFGPGIPEEFQARIFDRYAQATSEQPLERGSGLGLQISQSVAELHGGSIHVQNCPEGGCEFIVELPLSRGSTRKV